MYRRRSNGRAGNTIRVGAAEELLSQAFNFDFEAKLELPVRDPEVLEGGPLAVAQTYIQETPQSRYIGGREESNSEGLLRDHASNSSVPSTDLIGVGKHSVYQETHSQHITEAAWTRKKPRRLSEDDQPVLDDLRRQLDLLRSQNSELKRSIAASTRTIGQADDDTLRQAVTGLAFEIQDWAVNNVRKARLGMFAVLPLYETG